MTLNKDTKILIIGLGVIGGGYAAALTEHGFHVRCITKRQEDIEYALQRGMIEYGTTAIEPELIGESEIIIFAIYPGAFVEWVKENQQYFSKGTLITDVTGVKTQVVKEVNAILRDDVEFIAAHPMAGRERSGVEYSTPEVFRGANYIITPTKKNTEAAKDICKQLGEILGFARISELTPEEHDEMIAFLSQLTHCIAVTLMNCNQKSGLEKYTGDSFRDLTRIAKINENMWCELFMMNKEALVAEMDSFIKEFTDFKELLLSGNAEAMKEKMRLSTKRRTLFDKPQK